jgi:hypothetical protein
MRSAISRLSRSLSVASVYAYVITQCFGSNRRISVNTRAPVEYGFVFAYPEQGVELYVQFA